MIKIYVCTLPLSCILLVSRIQTEYPVYQKSQYEAKTYTMAIVCRIDEIISRPQKDNNSSLIIINSTFLVSFETTENQNIKKYQFEESSVPIQLQPNVINSTYPCFADPNNLQRSPLKYQPDLAAARKNFILNGVFPIVMMLLLIIMILAYLGHEFYKIISIVRPQFLYGNRPNPANTNPSS